MAKKGNRILYRLVNEKTGMFYVVTMNRQNKLPEKLKKFDKKLKKHVEFNVKKFKK